MGTTTLGLPYPELSSNYRPKEDIQALASAVDTLIAATPGTWANYTPAWSSSGTAPAVGNGSITGRYVQIGKTVHVSVKLLAGSTTTFGTGGLSFSLPVTASSTNDRVGSCYLRDASGSGTGHYTGICVIFSSTPTVFTAFESSTHSQLTGLVPVTWANTDTWSFTLTYEAA
jgi:hypothetical protein